MMTFLRWTLTHGRSILLLDAVGVAVLAVLAHLHLMPWDLAPLVAAMAERVRP